MQSEEFDKKIKEAAENHHPPYDEKAWMNMENLLDTHLPVEKEKKRRFIFILFIFILLGGGGYLLFEAGRTRGRNELALNQEKVESNKEKATAKTKDKQENEEVNPIREERSLIDKQGTEEKTVQPSIPKTIPATVDLQKADDKERNSRIKKSFSRNERRTEEKNVVSKLDEERNNKDMTISNLNKLDKEENLTEKNLLVTKKEDAITKAILPGNNGTETKVDSSIIKKTVPGEKLVTGEIKKAKKNGSSFFISASVAPDLSVVGSEASGIKIASGFGLGYTKGRVTLRSGFYTARKIYNAYPEDYNAPAAFYSYYPNLQEVKADCKVYEIPVLISYNFGANKNWFASTGLSSYLMKRETYDYYYKYTATSPVVNRERTIRNENNHYFTVLNLSAGYQRSISKRISVMAEPYVKIPLSGIGYGKVKLNSAGVLVSVAFKPFLPKIKK